ncbi:S1/P1 nuclease [uncultured Croceitalea sp.]|uniref:S1/P1 nuclease n=1 Tax=uncultured Croceitalea sp. TaxID=1798908 RepID=UPI00374F298B
MRSLLVLLFLIPTLSFANIWGRTGHRVTGHIAEKHLSKKAKKAIYELLDGNSLAFASTYADEIKSDRSFSNYTPWHYVNYPLTKKYHESKKSEYGNLVTAIDDCISILKDKNSSKEDKVFYLKLLIHFVGDLHQPMHAGRAADRGGNDIQVQWFGQGSNLHAVWDTKMLESYGMSYYELGDELDRSTTKKERKTIVKGTVVDWLEESHDYANELYSSVGVGEKLGYSYSYKYNPILFERLKKGGFRLAKILNEVFI